MCVNCPPLGFMALCVLQEWHCHRCCNICKLKAVQCYISGFWSNCSIVSFRIFGSGSVGADLSVMNRFNFMWNYWGVWKKEEVGRNENLATQLGYCTSPPQPTRPGKPSHWNMIKIYSSYEENRTICLIWIINFYYLSWKCLHLVFYCNFEM